MTPDVAISPTATPVARRSLRERRREHLRRAEQDLRSAQLAALHHVRAVLADAAAVVDAGWVQGGWFDHRGTVSRTAHVAARLGDHPIDGACLVGAIVAAGGGLAAAANQPVQRAIELAWHTLHADPAQPVRWCPAPAVRAAHVRDLTWWNDARGRTAGEVAALLDAAARRPV